MQDPRRVLRSHGEGNLLLREWENIKHPGKWLTLGNEDHPIHIKCADHTYEDCVEMLNSGRAHEICLHDDHLKSHAATDNRRHGIKRK